MRILPSIQRTYTDPSKPLTKCWKEGNTLKESYEAPHHADPKTRQRYHQKIKFQANISDDYIHENCQKQKQKSANQIQHTKKIIHHDYPRFTRMSQHVHINVIYHIKKQKSKPTWSSQ